MLPKIMIKASLIGLMIIYSGVSSAGPIPPDVLLIGATNKVVDVIKNSKDIQGGNLEKLSDAVKEFVLPHVDLDRVSHNILGKYWEEASDVQRESFKKEFSTFISYLYSTQLPDYKSEIVQFELPKEYADKTDIVATMFITEANNTPYKAFFSLGLVGDAWKVYDVNAEGVSFVATYRGQFRPLVKQSGMDALIKKLVEKNKRPAPPLS